MTAEVAVMNSMGIALAADSAVALGSEADKIYTSAEKLFELSENTPVGVMSHGNASFIGVPWETIIKCYRTSLASLATRLRLAPLRRVCAFGASAPGGCGSSRARWAA